MERKTLSAHEISKYDYCPTVFFKGGHSVFAASLISSSEGFGNVFLLPLPFSFFFLSFCSASGFSFFGYTRIRNTDTFTSTVAEPSFSTTRAPTRVRHSSNRSAANTPKIHNTTDKQPHPFRCVWQIRFRSQSLPLNEENPHFPVYRSRKSPSAPQGQ